jgi:hypothetical protein
VLKLLSACIFIDMNFYLNHEKNSYDFMILRSEFSLYFSYRVKNIFLKNLPETLVNPLSVGSLKTCNFGESFWRIFESLELL